MTAMSFSFYPRFGSIKKVSGLPLLFLLMFFAIFQTQLVPIVNASTLFVPSATYPTIQSAIDASKTGDIIQVAGGTPYYEHLIVDVRNLKIIGENKATTILDANETGTPILLEANKITITGFTIRNGGTGNGIKTNMFGSHNISNNVIENNVDGIYFLESNDNIIYGNTFLNNDMHAINIGNSPNNIITHNNISESAFGVYLVDASGTTISQNNISNTAYAIYVSKSSQNTISENTGQTSGCSILTAYSDHMTINNNLISGGGYGMYGIQLYSTRDSELANNKITEALNGIYMANSNYNTISGSHGNLIAKNEWGIYMYNSTGNQIINGNILGENTWGMYITGNSSENTIHHNNFVSNVRQAMQDLGCINTWDNGTEGNYWSDYKGYLPASGVDWHPLLEPGPMRNLATTNVTVSKTLAYPGDIVTVNATVKNLGVIAETFKLTTYFNSTPIGTQTTTLTPDSNTTLTYKWNTTNIEPNHYVISATAEHIPYIERNYTDNSLTDGTIYIIVPGDINFDGAVNIDDLILLTQAFGSTSGSPNWNSNADLNKDNIINALDLSLLGRNYGKTI